MITVTWKEIVTFTLAAGEIAPPWLLALEDLGAATVYLRLKAKGKWSPLSGLGDCGPDGLAGQSFPEDRLIVTDCPVGALIGRIGGSSATLKAASAAADSGESKPFPIGCHTIVKLPEKTLGPLYVGFNIVIRPMKLTELTVEISGAS